MKRGALIAVTALFLAWGFITSLIDPLVAAVKGIFALRDVEAQLSASAFLIAYGLVSLPAATLVARIRPMRSILIALAMMVAGCLVMLAAANLAVYVLVLLGLFVLASGITILQVAANPLAAAMGDPRHSHLRLTAAQAFNSVGTFAGPYVGATLFLKGLEINHGASVDAATRANALSGIDSAFFWIAGLIVMLWVALFAARRAIESATPVRSGAPAGIVHLLNEAVASRWTLIGGAAIFVYVGAEVSIGTQMALFLHSDAIWGASQAPARFAPLRRFLQLGSTTGVSLQEAGRAVSLYWGGAVIGRILGTVLLTRFKAAGLLVSAATVAIGLCGYIFLVGGASAGFVALAIGLCNSVMFPIIFSLTLERATARAEASSGFLCTAIVGGAFVPLLVGTVSGHAGYVAAFGVPLICYAGLLVFALAALYTPARTDGHGPLAVPH